MQATLPKTSERGRIPLIIFVTLFYCEKRYKEVLPLICIITADGRVRLAAPELGGEVALNV